MGDRAPSPPVVDLNAGCPIDVDSRSWIAVPLRAIAVVAPRPGQAEEANLLQHAVLGLLRTGLRDPDQLGRLLGLRGELVEIVMADLHANLWIDDRDALTAAGELAIYEPGGSLDYVQLWTFQEPWRGQILPRFTEDLAPAQVLEEGDKTIKATIGPGGNPREVRAWRVRPRDDAGRPVSQQDLVKAYGDFQDHRQQGAAYEGAGSEPSLGSPRIVPVPGRERDILALTFCFTSDRLPLARAWDVADPTGLWWLSALSDCIRRDPTVGLQASIKGLYGRSGRPDRDVRREQRRQRLGERIERRRPQPAADVDALADAWAGVSETLLSAAGEREQLVEALLANAGDGEDRGRRLARLLDEATGGARVLVAETLRQALATAEGASPAALRFSLLNAERHAYADAARMIGFGELPDVFVVRGRRRVSRSPGSAHVNGLPELVLESLTRAATDPRHLMRRLAVSRPELLQDLALLVQDMTWEGRLDAELAAPSSDGAPAVLQWLAEESPEAMRTLGALAATVAAGDATAAEEDAHA